MEGSGNNIRLLFRCKLDKVYGISGYADGQLGIILRMLLRIEKRIPVEYIDIQMMSSLY